jgi:hypothetical protein
MDSCGFDMLGAEEWFPAPTLAAVRGGVAVIKRGHQGDPVLYVQGLAGAIADGKFGEDTEKAVKAFQRARGISPVTGAVSSVTMAALDALAQGGTAGVEKIDFSKPESRKMPELVFEPDVVTLKTPGAKSVSLAKTASQGANPAWPSWKIAVVAVGGVAGLGTLLAALSGSRKAD